MQFRVYDRQTLAYKDGGYVASYTIDDDYIVNNNSSITFVKKLNDKVVVGDAIALIQTSGAYHKGIITAVDNADYTITYKSDKELFNDNIINLFASDYAEQEDLKIAARFGIEEVALILYNYFGVSNDWAKRLPLKFITEGDVTKEVENPETGVIETIPAMLWNWSNTSIQVIDWLVSLFERYNVSLSWQIDFDIANPISVEIENGKIKTVNGELDGEIIIHNDRLPSYVVTLSAVTNAGKIIKDNVANQTITYTEREIPEATVCVLIDKDSKDVVMLSSGQNLFNPNLGEENKKLTINDYGVSTVDDSTSNISGYIKVQPSTDYVLSFTKYDGVDRYIAFYNKEKTIIGDGYYSNAETTQRIAKAITIPATIDYAGEANIPAYIKITYYNQSEEIQFEQGSSATAYDEYNQPAIYYLTNNAGVDTITLDQKDLNRVFPVKTKYVEYDLEDEEHTEYDVAYENLVPSKFNQAVEIKISSDSKMFDFENAKFGDLFKIINKEGVIDTNYTGRKEQSGNKWVTLYFGLGRQHYTDLMQMRLRKSRYQVLY